MNDATTRAAAFNASVAAVCASHPDLHIQCPVHGTVCLYWLEAEDEPVGCPACRDEAGEVVR